MELMFSQKASLPSPCASASAFVIDNKAYIVCGRNASKEYLKHFWQYDSKNNTWIALKDVPFKGRVKAISETVGDNAYVGLGFTGKGVYADSCYLQDFWKYSCITKKWSKCADFPSKNSNVAISFADDRYIYVSFGFYIGFTNEVYKYDTKTDSWKPCKNANVTVRAGATGCTNGESFFAGTGYNTYNLNDWWQFNLQTEKWKECTKIPTKGRQFASSLSINNRIYLLGGRHFGGTLTDGYLFDDLLEYDIQENKWELRGFLPKGGRENMVTFTINGKGYFGLGENKDGKVLNDFYSWEE